MLNLIRFRALVALIVTCQVLIGCQSDLYTKLSEAEANEIVALLLRNSISASRALAKDGTSTVKVEEGVFADAVTLVTEAGLPRPKFATIGEVFPDTKLISSPIEQRARFAYATSQELSRTLSEIDGVIAARVHLVLPKSDPLRDEDKPSSASVFIKHEAGASVSSLLPQIKTLVANSIEGLTYEKVSVVFVPGERGHKITESALGNRNSFANSPLGQGPYLAAAAICALMLFGGAFFLVRRGDIWPLTLGAKHRKASDENIKRS